MAAEAKGKRAALLAASPLFVDDGLTAAVLDDLVLPPEERAALDAALHLLGDAASHGAAVRASTVFLADWHPALSHLPVSALHDAWRAARRLLLARDAEAALLDTATQGVIRAHRAAFVADVGAGVGAVHPAPTAPLEPVAVSAAAAAAVAGLPGFDEPAHESFRHAVAARWRALVADAHAALATVDWPVAPDLAPFFGGGCGGAEETYFARLPALLLAQRGGHAMPALSTLLGPWIAFAKVDGWAHAAGAVGDLGQLTQLWDLVARDGVDTDCVLQAVLQEAQVQGGRRPELVEWVRPRVEAGTLETRLLCAACRGGLAVRVDVPRLRSLAANPATAAAAWQCVASLVAGRVWLRPGGPALLDAVWAVAAADGGNGTLPDPTTGNLHGDEWYWDGYECDLLCTQGGAAVFERLAAAAGGLRRHEALHAACWAHLRRCCRITPSALGTLLGAGRPVQDEGYDAADVAAFLATASNEDRLQEQLAVIAAHPDGRPEGPAVFRAVVDNVFGPWDPPRSYSRAVGAWTALRAAMPAWEWDASVTAAVHARATGAWPTADAWRALLWLHAAGCPCSPLVEAAVAAHRASAPTPS